MNSYDEREKIARQYVLQKQVARRARQRKIYNMVESCSGFLIVGSLSAAFLIKLLGL